MSDFDMTNSSTTVGKCDTYAATVLSLISELFGPTHWDLYKQHCLNILKGASDGTHSAQILTQLIENRPAVVLLHNDLALQIHSGSTTDLPSLDIPLGVPIEVVQTYFDICHNYFAVEAVSITGCIHDFDEEAAIARQDAISFLTGQSVPTSKAQPAVESLLNMMATLGL